MHVHVAFLVHGSKNRLASRITFAAAPSMPMPGISDAGARESGMVRIIAASRWQFRWRA